jgi:glyoxylate reductase
LEKPKVYVIRQFFDEALNIINKVASVEVFEGENDPVPRELLLSKVRDIDGLIPMLTDSIDKELFDAAKKLKVVSNYAVGYNNIDIKEATKRGIMVTNTPEVLTDTTADCTFTLLMAVSRRLVEVDNFIRRGHWIKAWGPKMFLGSDIHGKTLGIVGLGRIGSTLAKRASGFDMKVIYNDSIRNKEKESSLNVEYREFEDLLKEADYVSLHVPLLNETKHLIGEKELRLMKSSAFLINTSRGPVVDEKALNEALKEGWIAGAALDVFEHEPIQHDNPLLSAENLIVTPHIGSATRETRLAMAIKAANNLSTALIGKRPLDLVNPDTYG